MSVLSVANTNMLYQMVCSAEPFGRSAFQTVWKRTGTFKKHLASDSKNYLSITVCHGLTLSNHINSRALPPAEPAGKSNLTAKASW